MDHITRCLLIISCHVLILVKACYDDATDATAAAKAYAALTFDAMRKEKKAALFQHLFDTSCRSTCHASLFGIAQSTSEHAILLRHQQCKLQQTGFGNYRVPRNQLVSSLVHVLIDVSGCIEKWPIRVGQKSFDGCDHGLCPQVCWNGRH